MNVTGGAGAGGCYSHPSFSSRDWKKYIERKRENKVKHLLIYGSSGFGLGVLAGLFGTILLASKFYNGSKFCPREIITLPHCSTEGDLNQDGLFPDAYIRTPLTSDTKIPFFLYRNTSANIQIYRSIEEMKHLYPERKTNYSEIERKLNEGDK